MKNLTTIYPPTKKGDDVLELIMDFLVDFLVMVCLLCLSSIYILIIGG